jgi:hypothetical protein
MRKGLLWFIVVQIPGHDQAVPLLWASGEVPDGSGGELMYHKQGTKRKRNG